MNKLVFAFSILIFNFAFGSPSPICPPIQGNYSCKWENSDLTRDLSVDQSNDIEFQVSMAGVGSDLDFRADRVAHVDRDSISEVKTISSCVDNKKVNFIKTTKKFIPATSQIDSEVDDVVVFHKRENGLIVVRLQQTKTGDSNRIVAPVREKIDCELKQTLVKRVSSKIR